MNKKKLAKGNIKTTAALLKFCCDKAGRKEMSVVTGIDAKQLLEFANRADLMRIRGVGEEYSDLLEVAGVDTVKELATRNVENLTAKMAEVNKAKKNKLVRVLPSEKVVKKWVQHAKKLKPTITH